MEETISTKLIYQGKIITVRLDQVLLENGHHASRELVEHPGAVAILALTNDGEVYFVRQYRKAVGKELLEIPAGMLEPGEAPAACAARELAEETGMVPGTLRLLAAYYTSPGFASEKVYIYQAGDLEERRVAAPDDEILEAVKMPFAQARKLALQGELEDGKTLIALLLAKP